MVPLGGRHGFGRVRRVLQYVVAAIHAPAGDLVDLRANLNHRVAEPIELRLVLALGRLHHQRAGDRKRDGRRMKTVVHQTLRHVHLLNPDGLELAQIEDQFMRHASVRAGIEDGIVRLEACLDVIGVEDGVLRGIGGAVGPKHPDIPVGNEQNAGAAPRRSGDGVDRLLAAGPDERVPGQIRSEVLRHADRTHARAAATMRNGEGLVQVEMAHVGANRRRAGKPHLRVHVGSVHVDLSAVLVHDVADGADLVLEYAVGRRVGNHQAREAVTMLRRLLPQICQIHVAVRRRRHHDDAHAGHGGAGGIGAVRGGRNQHDVAVPFPARPVMGPNHHQAGKLPLRSRVGLE